MASMIHYTLTLCVVASITIPTLSFIPSHHDGRCNNNGMIIRNRLHASILYSKGGSVDDDSGSSDDAGDDDDDDSLLDELKNTKKEMFGADIPANEDLEGAAQSAENAFLAAMLEQTQTFQQIKSEEGSDKACEAFMERIQEEDEAEARSSKNRLEREVSNAEEKEVEGNDDDSDSSIEKKWFVEKMQDGKDDMEGSVEGIDDENEDAWQ